MKKAEAEGVSKAGIVVVNYCGEADVLRCIDSLKTLDLGDLVATPLELVVVENASPDGSGARLLEQREALGKALGDRFQLTVLLSTANAGFAAGNNIGLSHLKHSGASHAWLLNPDTTVDPRAFAELLIACQRESDSQSSACVCGSKVLYALDESDGSRRLWSAGGVLDRAAQRVDMRGLGEEDRGQYDLPASCDYVPGCSMFLPLSVLDRVGFMPEEYFMYFEETDWCESMSRAGVALRYVPSSVVYHHFADEKLGRPFTVYYYNRNERLFWFRWGGAMQRLRLFLRTAFRDAPRAFRALRAAPDEEHRAVFEAQLSGMLDFMRGRSGKRRA